MARTRMVTRTIKETTVMLTAFSVLTGKIEVARVSLGTTDTLDETKLLKLARKMFETDTYKVVTLADVVEEETIYGMLETDFLKYASRLTEDRKFEDEPIEE